MAKTKILAATVTILIISASLLSISAVQGAFSPKLSSPAQSETTITLQWTQSDDWFFEKYNVTYSTSVNGPFYEYQIITDKAQTATFVDNLNPNTEYYFIVFDSGSAVGTTPSNTLYQKTKATPNIQVVSRTQTTVSLQWNDYNSYSLLVPFDSYVVQMSTNGNSWTTLTTISDYTQNTYTVTGLSPASYNFRMYDKVGTAGQYTSNSNSASVTIHEQPRVQISASQTTMYTGQQVELTSQVTGGTGIFNYQWYSNGNLIGSSDCCTFLPASPGTYTIYATVRDAQDSYLDSATSSTITLSVTEQTSNPTNPPTNQGGDGNNDFGTHGNTYESPFPVTYIIVVVVAIAIVGVAAGVLVRQKSGQKRALSA